MAEDHGPGGPGVGEHPGAYEAVWDRVAMVVGFDSYLDLERFILGEAPPVQASVSRVDPLVEPRHAELLDRLAAGLLGDGS